MAFIARAQQAPPIPGAPVPAPPVAPDAGRAPAPSGMALERAERRVHDAYEVENADKSDAARRKLLQMMLDDAAQTKDDPAGRYVLLRDSRRMATALGDASVAVYVGQQLETLYGPPDPTTSPGTEDIVPLTASTRLRARLPLPPEASLAASRKKIKTQYATFYANTTAVVRMSLVEKLLAESEAAPDAAGQYAALREAAEIAAVIGDLKVVDRCISGIASSFQVEEIDVRLAVLTAAGSAPGKIAVSARNLAAADLAVASDAAHADNYDLAIKALALAQAALGGANDEGLTARHAQLEKEVRESRAEFLRVGPMMKKLAEKPDDPELNLKAGRFYCLTAGSWKKGLPFLVKGSDLTLKVLAQNDLAAPAVSEAQLQLADGWFDRAASESNAAVAARCKQRAAHWYRRGISSATGAPPERAMSRFLSNSASVDLLAAFRPNRDVVSGTWTVSRSGLSCTNVGISQVQFTFKRPDEYDYIIQFTAHKSVNSAAQFIPAKDSALPWVLNKTSCFFEISATKMAAVPPMSLPIFLQPTRATTSILEVRRNGIRATVNGVVVNDWKTDVAEIVGRDNAFWKVKDPRWLGFGSWYSDVTLETARVIDISADPD
ncbi:MAG TPA: hypothetical protein VG326_14430 [Tepidisphaeraceae bacterium]|jgi:hypothetical protein|nr:hypothetical protein [Tepidisphaeraceae bacterium]